MISEGIEATEELEASGSSIEILEQSTAQWSQYVKVDTSAQDLAIKDLVDDLNTRLQEFEGLLDMAREQTGANLFRQMIEVHDKFKEVEKVFEKVDKLEGMVQKIRTDMDKMDRELSKAEATIVQEGSLKSFVPFLFGNARSTTGNGARGLLAEGSRHMMWQTFSQPGPAFNDDPPVEEESYQPVEFFSTKDFFQHL